MAIPSSAARVSPDRVTLLAFSGVVLLGGANALAVKFTVAELSPLWGAALRFLAAGAILLLWAALTRRRLPRGRSLWGAAGYGLTGFAASYGLLYTAIQNVPAGTLMVLLALAPLFTFALAIILGQERFHIQGLVGGLIAVVGVVIVFADQVSAEVPTLSLILVVLGALAIAASGVIVKWTPRSDPFATNGVAMLLGGGLLLALSIGTSESRTLPADQTTWLALAYLVALGSIAMFGLYVTAIQRWTASAMSYVTLLMPVVTVGLAAILLEEAITPGFLLGSAVILVGVYAGAFLPARPARSSSSSLPECLPVNDCPEAPTEPRTEVPAG